MLVVTRYRVEDGDADAFRADAGAALRALASRPGCTGATLGRAVDEPSAFEPLLTWTPDGGAVEHVGDLAVDAGRGGPGRRAAARVTPDDRSG